MEDTTPSGASGLQAPVRFAESVGADCDSACGRRYDRDRRFHKPRLSGPRYPIALFPGYAVGCGRACRIDAARSPTPSLPPLSRGQEGNTTSSPALFGRPSASWRAGYRRRSALQRLSHWRQWLSGNISRASFRRAGSRAWDRDHLARFDRASFRHSQRQRAPEHIHIDQARSDRGL